MISLELTRVFGHFLSNQEEKEQGLREQVSKIRLHSGSIQNIKGLDEMQLSKKFEFRSTENTQYLKSKV